MNSENLFNKIFKWIKNNEGDIVLVVGIILIALISFYLGILSASNLTNQEDIEKEVGEYSVSPVIQNIPIESMEANVGENLNLNLDNESNDNSINKKTFSMEEGDNKIKQKPEINENKIEEGEYQIVASKNGEVYHYVWCSGAKRIKEENKIYFKSKEEAEKAGLRPAKNCPGL